jgi:glycosyltransferase involved in cell wall biosynthesis
VLVSIVTPSLNGVDYLRECIESTRSQASTNVEVEHILVDGGSTDGTVELAAAEGCTVLTREEESVYAAINKGARNSNGTLLGTIGCDDVFLPGALDAVVRQYERTGGRWLVGGCRWMDERGVSRGDIRPPPSWLSLPMHASLGWNCFPNISTFMHRDFFFELDGYDCGFAYAGDYDLYARALQHGSFTRVSRILTGVRHHGANLSASADPRRLAEDRAVSQHYGPASGWQRAALRGLLRAWLNGTNPKWFICKRLDGVRARRTARMSSV